MPLDKLHANWAYTVIASLAWNLSRWIGLMLPVTGRWKKKHGEERRKVTRMQYLHRDRDSIYGGSRTSTLHSN